MDQPKHGGAGRGQGRKPKAASGELMRNHSMRWTDDGWKDVLLIGMDRVRELTKREADKVRKGQKAAAEMAP
jgi:hypothetical protein